MCVLLQGYDGIVLNPLTPEIQQNNILNLVCTTRNTRCISITQINL
jgi:hypothetical protein